MDPEESSADVFTGTSAGSSDDLHSAALSHVRAGRLKDAVQVYRLLLMEDPENIGVLNELGDLCLLVHDDATATVFFKRVLTLDPSSIPAAEGLERIATSAGSAEKKVPVPPRQVTVIHPIPLWDTDARFIQIMEQITYSLVDRVRCYMLYQFALQAARLGGDVAEVGVYRGGTARLLAVALEGSGQTIHLFDTFEGMPSTDPGRDAHRKGDFSDTSLESVKRNLEGCRNVAFYPGIFPATSSPVADLRFSLAHIDVDIYRSVIDCCEFFLPRMIQGGVIVFDDYGFESCPGAKEAVDEFFRSAGERPCYLPSGQCFVTKL